MPTEASQTSWGVGPIDEKGKFRISSYMASGHLKPGPYRIFLTPPRARSTEAGAEGKDREETPKISEAKDPGRAKFRIPDRFLRPQSSQLVVTLENEGNKIDIDLKD
jgi:hypothetical protein